MPIVGVLLGGLDFTSLAITVGEAQILYGNFIQAIVNFVVIGAAMFLFVKMASRIEPKRRQRRPRRRFRRQKRNFWLKFVTCSKRRTRA